MGNQHIGEDQDIGSNVPERWLSLTKQSFQVILLVILLTLILTNWHSVNEAMKRFLENSDKVSIADVLAVSITPKDAPSDSPRQEKWAAIYHISDKIKIENASLSQKKDGAEYLDITALSPINLGGAYIGDGKHMLFLGEADFLVQSGETVRIYTYDSGRKYHEKNLRTVDGGLNRRAIYVDRSNCIENPPPCTAKGIYKADPGEGDRIVMINRDKKVILDLDYWWTNQETPLM